MSERYYSARLMDDGGDAIAPTLGLQQILDAIAERWGGTKRPPVQVSPALSLGGGAALITTDAGRVVLERASAPRRDPDIENDGRVRMYTAQVTLLRVTGETADNLGSVVIKCNGLADTLDGAAAAVAAAIGERPACMSKEAIGERLRSIRAQISRARANETGSTRVLFPPTAEGGHFDVKGGLFKYRVAVDIVAV